jgi:hypothetical protein
MKLVHIAGEGITIEGHLPESFSDANHLEPFLSRFLHLPSQEKIRIDYDDSAYYQVHRLRLCPRARNHMTVVLSPISVDRFDGESLQCNAIYPFPSLGDFNVRMRIYHSLKWYMRPKIINFKPQPFKDDDQGKLLKNYRAATYGRSFYVELYFWPVGTTIEEKETDKYWPPELHPKNLSTSLLYTLCIPRVIVIGPNRALVRLNFTRKTPKMMIVNSLDSVESMQQRPSKQGYGLKLGATEAQLWMHLSQLPLTANLPFATVNSRMSMTSLYE